MSDVNIDNFDFSIAPRTYPVKINGEDFVLREATDDAKIKYLDAVRATPTFDTKGKVTGFSTSNTFTGEGILLAECLCKTLDGGVLMPHFSLAAIRKWPSRITDKLVAKIKEMSEMDKTDKEERDAVKKELATGVKDSTSAPA